MNLDNHILQALKTQPSSRQTMTIGDLARQLGATPFVVLLAAHRLVDGGLAAPSMVTVHGVPTLRGLSPLPAGSTASAAPN